MGRVGSLALLLALVAGCDPEHHDACQEACDITNPGLSGTRCQIADPCRPHAPNDFGLCLCTIDAKCPAGMEPWVPNPPPPPPGC